jgi:hypothetical protein
VLGPTGSTSTTSSGKSSAFSLLGTWVVQGTPAAVSKASVSTSASLPDFSTCSNFQWAVTNQTTTEAAGNFSAECSGGLSLQGNITAKLGGATIPIAITGMLKTGTDSCPFSLNGEGTPIDSVTFHITYTGSTCLGVLQGANNLSLAPHSAPTSFAVSGTITDGTSGGILPGIEVSAPGVAVRSDSTGHYQLPGVPTGAVTVQFAAAGYITQAVAPPPPAPTPTPTASNGDQIDLHSVIVRGPGGDVANWPVTTRIRVLDANFGGFAVDFDARSRWPEVVPAGWDGGIQYTLWIVEKINGQWITAGGVEYWRGLDRQGGPPSRLASNWYYSAQVWGELATHQPAPGEQVGFFVTAGDQRAKDVRIVTERSNVVVVPFPSDGGGYYPF